ncbi:MAG: 16S rRNA (cytosine(1402)-N(4))-methyltransferase RsmH [Clostridiales bacterium]|jgi:16S rRNA (cytosine1402-N4)-methyltransferase|nr:16S rRNA (cytosine(1402)-N(4))-methyltransferase RsmH [Clostridiales bacterium]
MADDYHIPVMLDETVGGLRVKKDGLYFDGTLGGGGHSGAVLAAGGRLIATDKDIEAIAYADKLLSKDFSGRYTLCHRDFQEAGELLAELKVESLDGAILDLGISSHQIDEAERGFSYMKDGALDMRMDASAGVSAADIVNTYEEEALSGILFSYGEERFSKRIARAIVEYRAQKPIERTGELADIVRRSVPYTPHGGHPAKRAFQALRIETNRELTGLRHTLETLSDKLCAGGRLCVITFHSLEDRIVKHTLKELATGCICDKSLPKCVCGHEQTLKLIGKIKPSDEEVEKNPRSASATLRIVEKLSTI